MRSSGGEDACSARREAESLALWLSNKMTRAQLEGTGFKIIASKHGSKTMDLTLVRDRAVGDAGPETYRPKRALLENGNGKSVFVYDEAWHTLTPAMTLLVRPPDGTRRGSCAVTVSGLGFVVVSPLSG